MFVAGKQIHPVPVAFSRRGSLFSSVCSGLQDLLQRGAPTAGRWNPELHHGDSVSAENMMFRILSLWTLEICSASDKVLCETRRPWMCTSLCVLCNNTLKYTKWGSDESHMFPVSCLLSSDLVGSGCRDESAGAAGCFGRGGRVRCGGRTRS